MSDSIEQINLSDEILLRIGQENDDHVISWDVLKNVGDKLELLIQAIARYTSEVEGAVILDNYKLDFAGFYKGSPVPAFKLNSHPTLSLFNEQSTREAVIADFSKMMNYVDKGNYQAIADNYKSPSAKNEIVKKVYDFTNSAGNTPVTIVKRDNNTFLKLYSVKKLSKEVLDKLIVPEIEPAKSELEETTAVAKMLIKKDKSGKIKRRISEIYDDKDAISSLKVYSIDFLTRTYKFKSPILFQIYSEGGGTIIENEQLDLYASGKTVSEAKIDLYSQFDHSYHRLNELNDEQLAPKILQVKQYLNLIVNSVIDK